MLRVDNHTNSAEKLYIGHVVMTEQYITDIYPVGSILLYVYRICPKMFNNILLVT